MTNAKKNPFSVQQMKGGKKKIEKRMQKSILTAKGREKSFKSLNMSAMCIELDRQRGFSCVL